MGQHLGTAFSAPQDAGIGEIANNPPDGGVVPHLAAPGPIAQLIQIGCNPLGSIALMHILVKNDTDNSSLGLVDGQFIKLMLLLVEPSALYKVVPIRGHAALKAAVLDDLAEGGFCADRGLFAFSVCLPESYVVGELVGMVVKPLLTLLGTPDTDAVLDEPLHHKGSFIRDAPDAVKHEHQQNIKLALLGVFFDNLELVTVFRPYLVTGHAVLLLLVNDCPALFLRKAVAGFPLHGNICLAFVVIVHLLVGGHSVKAINTVFHALIRPFIHIISGTKDVINAQER